MFDRRVNHVTNRVAQDALIGITRPGTFVRWTIGIIVLLISLSGCIADEPGMDARTPESFSQTDPPVPLELGACKHKIILMPTATEPELPANLTAVESAPGLYARGLILGTCDAQNYAWLYTVVEPANDDLQGNTTGMLGEHLYTEEWLSTNTSNQPFAQAATIERNPTGARINDATLLFLDDQDQVAQAEKTMMRIFVGGDLHIVDLHMDLNVLSHGDVVITQGLAGQEATQLIGPSTTYTGTVTLVAP